MTDERGDERGNTFHSDDGDYPLYGSRSDTLSAASGRPLRDLSLQKTLTEDIASEDYSISAETLRAQAEIARDAGYPQLAQNLERASELTAVPNETLLEMYEMLRPGRCSFEEYEALAQRLRHEFQRRGHSRLCRGGRYGSTRNADCCAGNWSSCRAVFGSQFLVFSGCGRVSKVRII